MRFALIVSFILAALAAGAVREKVLIQGGSFTPLYGVKSSDQTLSIESFKVDRYPVTNDDFLRFVEAKEEWVPGRVPSILADTKYLNHWKKLNGGAARPGSADYKRPVVNVSWFAANDYCLWAGGRLPTVLEWEYVAAASYDKKDASRDPEFVEMLLAWYSKPSAGTGGIGEIGRSKPNYWGVHDLHGLIWEWTSDFNSVFVAGDNRREGDSLENLFCGAGAASGTDKANYAAFMRYALRNSLKGHYTTSNLGFRCAYDL
ncbi:MAG: formylglycine-generating enzyme family protein [Deltaproteobacteria bacterium]|nr:formylglycine-generating enzyme family protein [Deltaproteobacteria bacterium]